MKISNHYLDFNYGQHDQAVVARHPETNEVMGHLQYCNVDGEKDVHIKHIEVEPQHRRKGVGKALVHGLIKHNIGGKVHWGMTTPEGSKLKDSMEKRGYKRFFEWANAEFINNGVSLTEKKTDPWERGLARGNDALKKLDKSKAKKLHDEIARRHFNANFDVSVHTQTNSPDQYGHYEAEKARLEDKAKYYGGIRRALSNHLQESRQLSEQDILLESIDVLESQDVTDQHLKSGLSNWVQDYKAMRKYGNIAGAKITKKNIDAHIKLHGLDRLRVYGGNPDGGSDDQASEGSEGSGE